MGWAVFGHRSVKAARGVLRHALVVADMGLVLGELREHRKLVGLLEATKANSHGAGFRGDQDYR